MKTVMCIFICVFVVFCIIRPILNSRFLYRIACLPPAVCIFIYCTSIVLFPAFVQAHKKLSSVFATFIQDVIFACPFKVRYLC